MPLYRPSELSKFLHSLGVKPKKSLSQNFLIDGNIINKILAAADVREDDRILEIGAGPGALTEALLEKKCHVVAVEKDKVFAQSLKRFSDLEVFLEVFEGDILDFPLDSFKGGKVVANLPYHLTTVILALLLPRYDLFSSVTVMVQEEVAQRMIAKIGSKDYSSLTLFVNFYSDARYNFLVKRKSFYPVPKVDSAVMTFMLKKPPIKDESAFIEFVRGLFCQRRKMITTILSPIFGKEVIEKELERASLNKNVRPEDVSLEAYLSIFTHLKRLS